MPPASAPPASTTAAWRATFADLAALLLCFFVLVSSVSAMDAARWSALSSALVEARLPGDRVPTPPTARSFTAPREQVIGATAADYLRVLLRQRLERASLVVPVTLVRAPDAVPVRFDHDLILRGGRTAPAARGELLIGRLVDLPARLDNIVSLRVRPAVTGEPAGGRATGRRTALAAHALAPDPAAAVATIEIVVHQDTGGA